jgi:integrase/recombinase XerD
VFLTLKAPIRPLSPSALSTMVAERLRALDIQSLRYGPHALRHACAGRLVAQGLSLKEIGDHLGHRSVYATRTYAKVDLAGLRAVADLSLGGLL